MSFDETGDFLRDGHAPPRLLRAHDVRRGEMALLWCDVPHTFRMRRHA